MGLRGLLLGEIYLFSVSCRIRLFSIVSIRLFHKRVQNLTWPSNRSFSVILVYFQNPFVVIDSDVSFLNAAFYPT
jgi:hypothetical protein